MRDLGEYEMPMLREHELDQLFVDPESATAILFSDVDGFRCRVYQDSHVKHEKHYIIGFGGTVPANVDDWINNFRQWGGLSADQYDLGVSLINNIRPECRDNVLITGHSLGGGIATVAALSHGMKGIVFNPPGIHKTQLASYPDWQKSERHVRRFVVCGEMLSLVNSIPLRAIRLPGKTHTIYGSFTISVARCVPLVLEVARLLKNPVLIASTLALAPILQKSIDLHGMNEVIVGLKRFLRPYIS